MGHFHCLVSLSFSCSFSLSLCSCFIFRFLVFSFSYGLCLWKYRTWMWSQRPKIYVCIWVKSKDATEHKNLWNMLWIADLTSLGGCYACNSLSNSYLSTLLHVCLTNMGIMDSFKLDVWVDCLKINEVDGASYDPKIDFTVFYAIKEKFPFSCLLLGLKANGG